VPLSIYANAYRSGGPWQYTVPAPSGGSDGVVKDYFNIGSGYGSGKYDLTCVGPNRFLRRFAGNVNNSGKACDVAAVYAADSNGHLGLYFALTNGGTKAATFTIASSNYLGGGPWSYTVPAGATVDSAFFGVIVAAHGWYDFTITLAGDSSWLRRYTGHIENGGASITG
jgi:phospholipase C